MAMSDVAQRVLIKVGGAALTEESALLKVTAGIQNFLAAGYQVIIVHGGGPAINAELTRQNITWSFLNGQRVTTPEMMTVIASTLGKQVNGQLVEHFSSAGISAVSVSGAQNNTLLCTQLSTELGLVGEIQHVHAAWIEDLLQASPQTVPVIAPLGVDAHGQKYNINADWAAAHIAAALNVDQLIYLTDQNGVWDQDKNICPELNEQQIQGLIDEATVQGGMLTKMRSVLYALNSGISNVCIMNGQNADSLTQKNVLGTHCILSQQQFLQEIAGAYATV